MYKLLIKKHNETGLKYLCKTTRDDYINYKGSGKYWKKHLKKHGYNFSTELIYQTNDIKEFEEKSLYYSKLWNIVKSEEWANLIEENGLDGGIRTKNTLWINNRINRKIN